MAISREQLLSTELKGLYDDSSDKVSRQDSSVSFNRTNARPIDSTTIFPSFNAASAWAATGSNAYPGHLLQVVEENDVKVYKVMNDGTLRQIDATIEVGDLPLTAGTGIDFVTSEGGKYAIATKLKSGNGLTVDTEGYLSVQQLSIDSAIDSSTSGGGNIPYTSAVYNALSSVSANLNDYVPTSAANSPTAGDKLQKASEVSATVENYISSLSADAVTANGESGYAITSISETNGKIAASAGKISVASADVIGLTSYVSSVSASTVDTISSKLSNAWEGGLSAANPEDPIILSSAISDLIQKGVTFGGVYGELSDISSLTNAIAGQVFVLTGGDYKGKEYICQKDNSTEAVSNFVEVGNEGAIATIAQNLNNLCTAIDGKVATSSYSELCQALSTSLEISALAHLSSVSADQIANKSVTSEKLSGLFVLSCGHASCDNLSIQSDGTIVPYPTT